MTDFEEVEPEGRQSDAPSHRDTAGSTARDASRTAIHDSWVDTWAVLGKASIPIKQLLRIGRGAVIVLDQEWTNPVELRANDRLIARGEIVILEEKIGVKITEMVGADEARQER